MCASVQRTGSLQRTPLAPQEFLAPLPFQQRGLLQAVGRRGQRGYRPATPGQPAVPGIPAVPGRTPLDPALHFLTLAHIFELECEGPAPWAAIAYLAGALGPVHTQAERNRMGSQAQFVARALAAGAHRHFGTSAGDDHSLASNLRDYLLVLAHALPTEFLSAGVAPLPLRAEFRDAIVYSRDADGRRSIEEARIFSFGNRCSFAELPPRTNLRNTPVPSMPYTLATLCHNPAITLVGLFSLSLAAVCCSPPPLGRTLCSWQQGEGSHLSATSTRYRLIVMAAPPTVPTTPVAPLAVLCPSDGNPQGPAFLPASHPLVLSTSFLDWTASPTTGTGGVSLVSLGTGQMLAAFGARLVCAKSPADIPAADKVNPLTIGLTGAAWSRVLNEYILSGLLNSNMASRVELLSKLSTITLVNPQNVCIGAADWQLAEDTTGSPGVPGTAAIPAAGPTPSGRAPRSTGVPSCHARPTRSAWHPRCAWTNST
mmetsp:Transcript_42554/g.97580  ORF Transcript_42554/g.97580 Transcript_42554/m.97580 type:complete len:484 (-) Transcript_42554:545-1996(-)